MKPCNREVESPRLSEAQIVSARSSLRFRIEVKTVVVGIADLGFAEAALTKENIRSDEDRDLFGNPAPIIEGRVNPYASNSAPKLLVEARPRLILAAVDLVRFLTSPQRHSESVSKDLKLKEI